MLLANPSWVADHDIWEAAKREAPGAPWGVITNIYKAKGGRIFRTAARKVHALQQKKTEFANRMKTAGVRGRVKMRKATRCIAFNDGKVGMLVRRKNTRRSRGAVRQRGDSITAVSIPAQTAKYLQEIHKSIGGVGAQGRISEETRYFKEPLAGVFGSRDKAVLVREWLRRHNWPARIFAQRTQSMRPDSRTRQARAGRQYGHSIHNVFVRLEPNDEPRFQQDMALLYAEHPELDRARVGQEVGDHVPMSSGGQFEYVSLFIRKLQANMRLAGTREAMAPLPADFIFNIGAQTIWIDTRAGALETWMRERLSPDHAIKILPQYIRIEGTNFSLKLTPDNVASARVEAGETGLRHLSITIREV